MDTIRNQDLLDHRANSGFGKAFFEGALAAGHRVVGTVRKPDAAAALRSMLPDRAFPLVLDVTDFDAIPAAVDKAERLAGTIDVLVNNAGYGHEGALEEISLDDMRSQFDANVFGAVAVMKAVLPGMRQRRSAISSTSRRWAASSPCRASPHTAVASSRSRASSEALAKEVKHLGIRVSTLRRVSSAPIGPGVRWSVRHAASPDYDGSHGPDPVGPAGESGHPASAHPR